MFDKKGSIYKPKNEKVKIWRFLDFTKFVSILDTKSLFFSRLDLLGDPFEGSYPKFIFDNKKHLRGTGLEHVDTFLELSSKFRRHFAVNCWHINDYESAGMWSLYLKNKDGVAIQTTFNGLADSFKKTAERISIGQVNYIDYDQESFPIGNISHPVFHKRKSFEHEKELRAVIWKLPKPVKNKINLDETPINLGIYVPVTIKTLIKKIYVAPNSPNWFHELVKSIAKKYKLDIPVLKSDLDKPAIFK